jgi:hypothetical protein
VSTMVRQHKRTELETHVELKFWTCQWSSVWFSEKSLNISGPLPHLSKKRIGLRPSLSFLNVLKPILADLSRKSLNEKGIR